ncbi:MAG: hypothetical protein IIX15_00860 [Clostridia bacterium]|nr:hypothetical protein [Clostridia bacterium]
MKTYSFERVYGNEAGEQVEIHRKNHGLRLGTKLLCLLLAFIFWLVVTNVELSNDAPSDGADGTPKTQDVA